MRSSKLLRLPQRGALGNGLRVVAGAVLASEGSLAVITRNRRIVLRPEADGSTTVVEVIRGRSSGRHPHRDRIRSGPAARSRTRSHGSRRPREIAFEGKSYEGKSSPYWYDPAQFHELLLAHGQQPVRSLIAQLDGCSGGKAGEIVAAAGLDRMACASVTRGQAATLLAIGAQARPPRQSGASRIRRPRRVPGALLRHRAWPRAHRHADAAGRHPVRGRGVGQEDRREGQHHARDAGEPHARHRRDQHLS